MRRRVRLASVLKWLDVCRSAGFLLPYAFTPLSARFTGCRTSRRAGICPSQDTAVVRDHPKMGAGHLGLLRFTSALTGTPEEMPGPVTMVTEHSVRMRFPGPALSRQGQEAWRCKPL
jgi:hypothetical protein